MSICYVSTEERNEVHPELVECSNSSRCLLSHVESTRLAIGEASTSAGTDGKRLLDEVCDLMC